MPDISSLSDPAVRRRLAELPSDFCGSMTIFYEAGRLIRAEIAEPLSTVEAAPTRGVNLSDSLIRRRLESLPRNFYGRVVLTFRDGQLAGGEIVESIKPHIDRERIPLSK